MSDTEINEDDFAVVFSIKLITGEHILAEIEELEDINSPTIKVLNPLSMIIEVTSKGEVAFANKYDPFTDEKEIEFRWDIIASKPTVANPFYTKTYVHTLMKYEVQRVVELINTLELESKEETDAAIKEYNAMLVTYADKLSKHFGVPVNQKSDKNVFQFEQHNTIQ